ncbi:hypothetical protein BJ742DRAFT_545106 [Cladochytrium replicatum]|nr:hypothetical protein BJ742DRAFT_545106 [Cladochytrium replicatum]
MILRHSLASLFKRTPFALMRTALLQTCKLTNRILKSVSAITSNQIAQLSTLIKMYYLRELLLTYLLALPATIALVVPLHKRQPTGTALLPTSSNVPAVNATNSTILASNSTNSTNSTLVHISNGTNLTAWVLGNVSVPGTSTTSASLTVTLSGLITATVATSEITSLVPSPATTTTEPSPTDFVLMPVKRDVPILPPALNATTTSTTWINGSNSTNSTLFPLNSTNITWPINSTNYTTPGNATPTTNTVTIPELATKGVTIPSPPLETFV